MCLRLCHKKTHNINNRLKKKKRQNASIVERGRILFNIDNDRDGYQDIGKSVRVARSDKQSFSGQCAKCILRYIVQAISDFVTAILAHVIARFDQDRVPLQRQAHFHCDLYDVCSRGKPKPQAVLAMPEHHSLVEVVLSLQRKVCVRKLASEQVLEWLECYQCDNESVEAERARYVSDLRSEVEKDWSEGERGWYHWKMKKVRWATTNISCLCNSISCNIRKLIHVMGDEDLEIGLRRSAVDQLAMSFVQHKDQWDIVRSHEFLTQVLAVLGRVFDQHVVHKHNMLSSSEVEAWIVSLLEVIKLRMECNLLLDDYDCVVHNSQQLTLQVHFYGTLLPYMFHLNDTIRYITYCIFANTLFHPSLLLCHFERSPSYVTRERQCYMPKLASVYSCTASRDQLSSKKMDNMVTEAFHMWIPKFLSHHVKLLCPFHKIRWTSPHTRDLERCWSVEATPLSTQTSRLINSSVMGEELLIQNEQAQLMINASIAFKQQNKSPVSMRSEYEKSLCTQLLQRLQSSTSHEEFLTHFHALDYLNELHPSLFRQHIGTNPFHYAIVERFLKTVPSSNNDGRLFIHVCSHVLRLLNMNMNMNNDNDNKLIAQFTDKLGQYLTCQYIPWLESVAVSQDRRMSRNAVANDKQEQEPEDRRDSRENVHTDWRLSAIQTGVMASMLQLMDAWIRCSMCTDSVRNQRLCEVKNNIVFDTWFALITNQKEHQIAFRKVTSFLLIQTKCDIHSGSDRDSPTSLHSWIYMNVRMQLSLQFLYNVLNAGRVAGTIHPFECSADDKRGHRQDASAAPQEPRHVLLRRVFDVLSHVHVPNALERRNVVRLSLLCLESLCEPLYQDSIFDSCKRISWILYFLSHRDVVTSSLAFSVLCSFMRCCRGRYQSGLKVVWANHLQLRTHIFGAIKYSSHALVRAQALDCLCVIVEEHFEWKKLTNVEKLRSNEKQKNKDTAFEINQSHSFNGQSDKTESFNGPEFIETEIVNKLTKEMDFWKLLNNIYHNGSTLFFRSLLVAIKTVIYYQLEGYQELVHDPMYFSKYLSLLNPKDIHNILKRYVLLFIDLFANNNNNNNKLFCVYGHQVAVGIAAIEVLNCIYDTVDAIEHESAEVEETEENPVRMNRQILCERLLEETHLTHILILWTMACETKEYEHCVPICNLFCNLLETKNRECREALHKAAPLFAAHPSSQTGDPEDWFEDFFLEKIASCFESNNEQVRESILNMLLLYSQVPASDDGALLSPLEQESDNTTVNQRKVWSHQSKQSFPKSLQTIVTFDLLFFVGRRFVCFNFENRTLEFDSTDGQNVDVPRLLPEYYHALGSIVATSKMAKMILADQSKDEEGFLDWLTFRVAQIAELFAVQIENLQGCSPSTDQTQTIKPLQKNWSGSNARNENVFAMSHNNQMFGVRASRNQNRSDSEDEEDSQNQNDEKDGNDDKDGNNEHGNEIGNAKKNKAKSNAKMQTTAQKNQLTIQTQALLRTERTAMELCRLLHFLQNYLFAATCDIKVVCLFVCVDSQRIILKGVGEILTQFYPSTLDERHSLCHLIHDNLLKACINLASHCKEGRQAFVLSEIKMSSEGEKTMAKGKKTKAMGVIANRFLFDIVREAFAIKTKFSSYHLCFELLQSMMLCNDGVNYLITNWSDRSSLASIKANPRKGSTSQCDNANKNLFQLCLQIIQYSQKNSGFKHRRLCCIKLLCNLTLTDFGQSILAKYFLPTKLDEMRSWLDITDNEFLCHTCEYFRNLSFNASFKTAFCLDEQFIRKIFIILVDESYESAIQQCIKEFSQLTVSHWPLSQQLSAVQTFSIKLSLVTLLWKMIHHNQKVLDYSQKYLENIHLTISDLNDK
ncbi:hypothetical protein RFI_28350 [Reticulomyxa filosa]|uniref:Uncharacterized protein n=1 Tax=Reticulomyxa filosa TaxID=46433 RepID=X6M4X7_RETFI|nr:hypothetical protein RFI_28350 [Reticulomyxa filosa]|eukprot:ETO09038.1 hypothetical protein RFI_28350 [Reticulomyxa filosa]